MEAIQHLREGYTKVMYEKSDPRTVGWLMVTSPQPVILACLAYIFIVVYAGPRLMKSRQAFNLKYVLIAYNLFCVCLSTYMTYEFVVSAMQHEKLSAVCLSIDYSNSPHGLRLASVAWMYYFSKYIEFLDTIFFVLRKKNNQITFLHVYHHVSMPALWFIGVRFVGGGECYFSGMVNSFVHMVMYTYYMLAACGPHMQKYLWWKKYLTKLQLAQFFLIIFKTIGMLLFDHECNYPRPYAVALFTYCLSLSVLFLNFYFHTYRKKASKGRTATENGVHPVSNGVSMNGVKKFE